MNKLSTGSIEYSELEGIHKDDQVQLLAPQNVT